MQTISRGTWEDMNIFGINSSRAAPPRVDPGKVRHLADGGAALLQDGRIACAAIEERFTRVRYSGGFRESAMACLNQGGIELGALDAVGHSTCCDIAWSNQDDILDDIAETLKGIYSRAQIETLKDKVFTVDHHESHAAIAFAGSGFQKALVAVIDGIGNRKAAAGEFNITDDWWRGAFQRHDYYICEWRDGRIHFEKVHEDAGGVDEIGIGEIYRSVTHFLGWPTYQHAGKTMALAPFGRSDRLAGGRFIEFAPPFSVRVPVPNLHNDPIAQVGNVIRSAGYPLPDMPMGIASPENSFLCDIAALVQQQLESALARAVAGLAERYGVANVAFGGGVSMNCVALGKFAAQRPDLHLYVPPAPADTGLALGNALWLAYAELSPVAERVPFTGIGTAALGIKYNQSEIDRAVAVHLENHPDVVARRFDNAESLAEKIVDDLAAGKVIGLRQGRSEYGPRALGQSSILADPRSAKMHDIVNSFKRREPFRPYAPSILSEQVQHYFVSHVHSPFMSFSGIIREDKRRLVPAVVHVDGSARYQSVGRDVGFYRLLLESWYRRTDIPILLNTSFNVNGEPIVETPQDALDCFERSGLPVLVLGNWHLERTLTFN